MCPARHLWASAAFGAGVYLLTGDGGHAAAAGAGGVLIDLDHIWDFYREWGVRGGLGRMSENFVHGRRHEVARLYLLLHSWDVLLFLALLAVFGLGNFYLLSAVLGGAVHLLFDQFVNPVRPFSYFLAYRISRGFRRELLVDPFRDISAMKDRFPA